jgi:hypothetical protein
MGGLDYCDAQPYRTTMKLHPIPPSAGHILILLLLICAVCSAPGMAADKQSKVTEDGVHLIKFDTSPTILVTCGGVLTL